MEIDGNVICKYEISNVFKYVIQLVLNLSFIFNANQVCNNTLVSNDDRIFHFGWTIQLSDLKVKVKIIHYIWIRVL